MSQPGFRDRRQAGKALGEALRDLRGQDPLVLGLPRGGVPVAYEVALALDAELDVVVSRKLGVPYHPEFGFGAIALHAEYIDMDTVARLDLSPGEIEAVKRREHDEMIRRVRLYRGGRPAPRINGRTVIVIDDGVATGGTARAALDGVRREGPAHLAFAAPVGPVDVFEQLSPYADEIIVLRTPDPFGAVGAWYERFGQTTDEEVLALLDAARVRHADRDMSAREIEIDVEGGHIAGTLVVPPSALGLVIFAHGSGSSRFSPRNRSVAKVLQQRGLATLLLDLLTPEEERIDERTLQHRFDIDLLATRLLHATSWTRTDASTSDLRIGYFGSSTGGAAALVAAGRAPSGVSAVVSRGGRPDLAGDSLPRVRAPTLLIVGERDTTVLGLNAAAKQRMTIDATVHIVPGATHLFDEPGALEEVSGAAADWFARHLAPAQASWSSMGTVE